MKANEFSKVFSSQLRLAIVSTLINQNLLFSELKEATGTTDGNLSVQLKNLEKWGFISSKKILSTAKLSTQYNLTEKGLDEFEQYVSVLESVLKRRDENTN